VRYSLTNANNSRNANMEQTDLKKENTIALQKPYRWA
jgi:hypothetical protein